MIIETMKSNLYLLDFENGQLVGEGAKLIGAELGLHQFVLVGEQHGIAEVGEFCEGLFNQGKNHGFSHFAIETDPWVAAKLEECVSESKASLLAFTSQFPFTIPFYDNESDFSFLHGILDGNDSRPPRIWGLDQAFMTTSRFLLNEMQLAAKSNEAQELAANHLNNAHEAFQTAMGKQDPSAVYMTRMTSDDFQALESVFKKENNKSALSILNGLRESQKIYNHWFNGRYYQNNRVRSGLMKSQFMDYFLAAEKELGKRPKVMFKFGSNHAIRGLTSVNIYDLGNMVSELAESNDERSLHIRFVGIKGASYNMLIGNQTFNSTKDIEPRILKAMGDHINGEKWVMIDMRPLRDIRMKNESDGFKSKVFGWDLLIYVPVARAQVPFGS